MGSEDVDWIDPTHSNDKRCIVGNKVMHARVA